MRKVIDVTGRRLMAALGLFLTVATTFFDRARAEEACPPDISPDNPIVTEWKGLRLDTPGYVNVRHVWLKIPVGYWFWEPVDKRGLYLRPPAERTDPAFDEQSFSFWMPDGRWPERLTDSFHPCEQGRARPGEGNFKVTARLKWIGLGWYDNRLPFTTPAEMNRNVLNALAFPSGDREFGLVRFQRPSEQSKQYYAAEADEPFEINLHCSLPDQAPNPSCVADVFWPKEQLLFWMHFSYQDLPRWRKTIETARLLVERWRADAVSEMQK